MRSRETLRLRAGLFAWLAMGVVALLPLWWFDVAPSADLPNHVAISSILARLLGGSEDAVANYYAPALPYVPYHLAYLLLTPLVGALGPLLGQRVFLTLLGSSTLVTTLLVLRQLGRPWPAALGGVFIFYSALFFWGFISTAVGIPTALFGFWCLLRYAQDRRRSFLVGACVAGVLTCLAHVLLLPLWLCLVVAYVSLRPAANVRSGVVAALAAFVPLLPALAAALTHPSDAESCVSLFYRNPTGILHHFKRQFSVFGKGIGRAGHLAFVLVVLGAAAFAWWRRARRAEGDAGAGATRRVGVVLLLCGACLFFIIPVAAEAGENAAWGINFRYFVLVELGVLILYPALEHPRWRMGLSLAALSTVGLFLIGLWGFWGRFDRAAAPARAVLAQIPPGQTLSRSVQDPYFEEAWPPLRAHLPAFYVANGGAYDHGIFAGGHVPLRPLTTLHAATDPSGRLELGEFDVMVVEGDVEASAMPRDGELVSHVSTWWAFSRCDGPCGGEVVEPRPVARVAATAKPYWNPEAQKRQHELRAAPEKLPRPQPDAPRVDDGTQPTVHFCF